jgi:hypothetical protein
VVVIAGISELKVVAFAGWLVVSLEITVLSPLTCCGDGWGLWGLWGTRLGPGSLGRGNGGALLLKNALGPIKRGSEWRREVFFFGLLRNGTGDAREGCDLLIFGNCVFSMVEKKKH